MNLTTSAIPLLDSSTLSDYTSCPRRYFFRHVLGLEPTALKLSLGFGLSLHEALEVAYRWLQQNPGAAWTPDIITKARDQARLSYTKYIPDDAALTEELRTAGKLDTILKKYFAQYAREPFTVLDVEMSFALAVGPDGYLGVISHATEAEVLAWAAELRPLFLWIGRMDLVVEWSGIRTLDHKSTSVMGTNWAKQWSPNTQMSGYVTVLEQLHDAHRVNGAVINGVQVAKTMYGMTRHPTTRRPEELRAFHASITSWFQTIRTDTTYPQNTNSCTSYGECPFRGLCLRCPEAPTMDHKLLLASAGDEYRLKHWNPLNHEG